MPIPDLSNKPGPGRPGYPTGAFEFQFRVEGTEAVVIKANAAASGNFTIKWPNGNVDTYSGNNASITAPDATDGIVSINNEELDTTYCDEFAVIGGKGVVREVISWGKNPWSYMTLAFDGCTSLSDISTTSFISSTQGDMVTMFNVCTSLLEVDIRNWDLTAGADWYGGSPFRGLVNLQKLDMTGLKVKLNNRSDSAFAGIGTAVTDGCEFLMSGCDWSTSTSTGTYYFVDSSKIKPTSNLSNWVFPSSGWDGTGMFRNVQLTGTNSILNCSGWSTYSGTNVPNFQGLNSGAGDTGAKLNLTNLNLSNVNSFYVYGGCFQGTDLSGIIGLSTWGATAGNVNMYRAFYHSTYFKFDNSDNFTSTFIESLTPTGTSFRQVFDRTGTSLAYDPANGVPSDYGDAPNITNIDLSGVSDISAAFTYSKFKNVPDLGSATFNSSGVNFYQLFLGARFSDANSHFDLSNTTVKLTGNCRQMFQSTWLSNVTFGNNVDFSTVTDMYRAHYYMNSSATGDSTQPVTITYPTSDSGLSWAALTQPLDWFVGTVGPTTGPLTTCQVDNLIRSFRATAYGSALNVNFYQSKITEAPSVVNAQEAELVANGWTITENATDATLPFAYASYAVDPTGITTISPTTTPPAGSVFTATNSLSINSSTGVITPGSFRGGSTIRCTYPDGCYNEVVMLIQVPFTMNITIPSGSTNFELKPQMSAGECFVDWGDNSSQILTANTTHSYASSGSDQTYPVKIFDSPSGSKFTGFNSSWSATSGGYIDDIAQWGEIEWQNNSWFANTSKSTITATDTPNLSQVTSLQQMFSSNGINSTFSGGSAISNWDVSTITNMSSMFWKVGSANFTQNLSNWDVSNVTTLQRFNYTYPEYLSYNQNWVADWGNKTSNVEDFSYFMYGGKNNSIAVNSNMGNYNTSSATNMTYMFFNNGGDIANCKTKIVNAGQADEYIAWDVKKVENFSYMFAGGFGRFVSTEFPDNWYISGDSQDINMQNMFGWFYGSGSLNNITDLNSFATKTISAGTSPYGTQYTAWNMSNTTNLIGFTQNNNANQLNWNINTWQISNKLTRFDSLLNTRSTNINWTYTLDQDLGHWDISNVTNATNSWFNNYTANPIPAGFSVNFSRANLDSMYDITDGWGSQAASVQSGITLNMGASKFTGNNVAIGTATVNGTSTNLIAGGSPFSSSMVGGIVTLTSGTNSGQQAKITTFNSASSVTISRAINLQAEQNTFTVDTTDAAKGRFALSDPDGPAWIITDGGKEVPFDPLKLQVRVPANSSLAFSFAKITSPSNVNATLKWGDGQESTINTVNSIPTHTYTNNTGSDVNYELELNQGSDSVYCTGFRFDDNLDATSRAAVRNLTQWGDTSWVSMASAFKTCTNLDITATDGPVITSNTSLTHSFGSCTSLVNSNGSIGNWDVSQLTALYVTFDGCTNFNVDISKWDTSSVGNMNNTFLNCTSFNQDLSTKYITAGNSPTGSAYWAWNTSSVSNMGSVFKGATNFNCGSNANGLSNWNTSSATTMFEMFESSGYNKPLNTNLVPAASSYSGSDYVAWDVDNVVDFREMFRDNTSFNQDIGKWKFKSTGTIAFNYMLKGATAFAQDISTKTITAGNSPYGTQYTAWDVSRANSLTRVIAGTNVNVLLNWSVGQWSTYALHSWGGASAAGGLSVANYTDQIVKWANDVNAAGKTPTGIYAVVNSDGATVPNYDSTRTYGSGFANAGRARSYLSLDVTVSGSGDSSINGVYYYDYANSKWVRENDANIQIAWNGDESVWELSVEGEATNSGSGGSQAGGPTSVTSWSGGITVADSSAGWTFNGTVTT